MADTKIVIVVSNFGTDRGEYDFREIPELDKLFNEGWTVSSIRPVVNKGSTNSSYLGSMQLVVRLQKN